MKKTTAFIVLLLTCNNLVAQVWTSGADIPTPIRAGNTAAYSKNGEAYLFVVSGRDNNGLITTKHQRYQLGTDSWTEMAPHPTGLLGASTAILQDSLYVIGGLLTTPGAAIRKVYRYSINENTWSQAANFPVNIVDSDAVAYQDSLIYVAAGYSNKVRVYNAITNRWRLATPMTPAFQSLSWGALTVRNDTLVYMCGTDSFLSPNYYNTVRIGVIDQSDRANITWTEAAPFPGATRTFFDACPWKDGIIMTGGSTDNTFETYSGECYFYNVGLDTWAQLPSKPTPWLTGNSGSVVVGDEWKLLCAGGFATDYLPQTEIFSQPLVLDIPENETGQCGLQHFKFISGHPNEILFCAENSEAINVTIRDINGRIVELPYKIYPTGGVEKIRIGLDYLAEGMYFCMMEQGNETVVKKIMVSK